MRGPSLLPGRPWSATRRLFLWGALVALIVALLAMLMWLTTWYDNTQMQDRLDRDAADVAGDIHTGLARNVERLQALQARVPFTPEDWAQDVRSLLRGQREMLRVERRDINVQLQDAVDSPYRAPIYERVGRGNVQLDVHSACLNARRGQRAVYVPSYFVPQADGLGFEVMEVCLPLFAGGAITGYVVATYGLNDVLSEMVGPQSARNRNVSFTDIDGTRLAYHGTARHGSRAFMATQMVELPGLAMLLRMESWRDTPAWVPNFLTAMVAAMTVALTSVLVLLGRDTRRRLRIEQRLSDALAFRKAMEDSLVAGLRARDLRGRTTYVNPAFCQMVGFSSEELLLPTPMAPYWPPEVAERYQQRVVARDADTPVYRDGVESVFMRKDGSRFPVLIFEAPLIDGHGMQTGWMSAFLDISEQRRMEELARATQERLQATARLATMGEMASLLSHELNQPLAAISSYAAGSINMLQHDWRDDAWLTPSGADSAVIEAPSVDAQLERNRLVETAVRQIAEQAQRAGKVIKSVHDFVRRRESREPVHPPALLEAVMPLVALRARKQSVRIQTFIDAGLPMLVCDRTMVEQVLMNLTRNAIQAMEKSPLPERELVLRIRRGDAGSRTAHHSPGGVEFSVADFGEGISTEVAQRLFTPFFTTKSEGMGLGLSMCRTVVEQHGGTLEYTANDPHGTIFSFILPVSAATHTTRA